jgi:hypothetical protein
MRFAVAWILFGLPAVALVFCWRKLLVSWRDGACTMSGLACLTLTSISIALALTALAWTEFVRPSLSSNYRVELSGLLLSFGGVIAGLATRQKHRHRYLGLGLAAAGWTLILFFLAASTY